VRRFTADPSVRRRCQGNGGVTGRQVEVRLEAGGETKTPRPGGLVTLRARRWRRNPLDRPRSDGRTDFLYFLEASPANSAGASPPHGESRPGTCGQLSTTRSTCHGKSDDAASGGRESWKRHRAGGMLRTLPPIRTPSLAHYRHDRHPDRAG
jgi:hypothetical protein